MMNKNTTFFDAQWIWHDGEYGENEYAEFAESFISNGGKTTVKISARGDYTLFINGRYVSSGQYADFEYYKTYDETDITEFLHDGTNTIAVLGWYFGKSGMRWNTPMPGIIYEVKGGDAVICASTAKTPCRKSRAYCSGFERKISAQLGYSFAYDSAKEDAWTTGGGEGFGKCRVMPGSNELYKRPIKKHTLSPMIKGVAKKTDSGYLVDFGHETVGLCSFSLASEAEQKINIAFGELLENGHVKRRIGDRDFSFDYTAKKGENEYTNYMLRFGCRYMEITCGDGINLDYLGIIPTEYDVEENPNTLKNELDRKIYDMCVNTLKLCMMEHYVDCPWREQCLYAFDSRNQIMAGYSAFKGGNLEYARANLRLMSKDDRKDGLLSICYPSGEDLTIPSFSLYFVISVKEYLEHSGDTAFAEEVYGKLKSIIEVFLDNMRNNLVYRFGGKNHWNFYDWSPYCDGEDNKFDCDFILNALTVSAINAFGYISEKLGKTNDYAETAQKIAAAAKEKFFDKTSGLFVIADPSEKPTELANSLAVLSGIADGEEAKTICGKLSGGELVSCSLSMKTFKYDAMLSVDGERYRDDVLDEIRRTYKIMLDAGSDTAWEVIEGAPAFDNAGSLCHGWSAMPVHYLKRLLSE